MQMVRTIHVKNWRYGVGAAAKILKIYAEMSCKYTYQIELCHVQDQIHMDCDSYIDKMILIICHVDNNQFFKEFCRMMCLSKMYVSTK